MKILIVAGFLGAGKTTLILRIARKLNQNSRKIAIIENEIGDIGIDGDYLNLEGLYVQELFGGCICCTLTTSLIETLRKLELQYKPDIVIVEPTGIAMPGDIRASLRNLQSKVESIQVITVLDAGRYEMLMEMMEPLLTAQIQSADIVAINKIDKVEPETINRIFKSIDILNPLAEVTAISAEESTNLNTITDAVT